MLRVMDACTPVLRPLSRGECLRLMATAPIGRIVYTRQAMPAVEVVNFAVVDGDIVIRTSAEGKLAEATRGAVVAFEADSVDSQTHRGWSVTIVGHARVATGDLADRLDRIGPTPWVPGPHAHFICIAPTIVNGKRLGDARLCGDSDADHQ